MAQTLLPPLNLYNMKLFSSNNSRSQPRVVSIRKLRSLVLQASKDDMGAVNFDVSHASSSNPLFSLIKAPTWLIWLMGGSSVVPSVSFYRKIRKAQDRLEATVDAVAETVENVAEKVEKISCEMADALPDGTLKEIILAVEKTADIIDKSAEKTGNLIDKLDDIEAKVDAFVDPSNKGEAASKEGDERKQA
ncbi:uncharacterized protein LOC120263730 [Dioscorea cayenensis subsp. rotundata]|uniref:Uncharacterized protein LOC120263730 n=1 Tax=Dioscorea cayennensis subsp. rotundata TaxID=55577 RepID=A0AB40BJX5_DIOCR|nr:uncharacterized protein LOC120263730 [Dioscorea cayenensis subsp. rotundata]